MKRLAVTILFFLAALPWVPAWASGSGYLGIAVAVSGEGAFWNPTISAVKVQKVNANSPAARAGIAAGDEIVEVQGKPVVGTKARELQPYMELGIGDTLRLVVRKPTGELQPLSLRAEPRPQ